MPEYKFTDETATTVVLHTLINDMKHVLDWLTIGLGCLALIQVIRSVGDFIDGDWIALGLDIAVGAFLAWAAYGTARRASKYQPRRMR